MLTRGIVEERVDNYKLRVRIPKIHKIASDLTGTTFEDLSIASVCTLPSIKPYISVGDVVIVACEDEDIQEPTVIGVLYREAMKENSAVNITASSLKASVSCELPKSTTIGEITSSELQCLIGCTNNIQNQLTLLDERIKKLEGNKK